jgi:hypothetical protein
VGFLSLGITENRAPVQSSVSSKLHLASHSTLQAPTENHTVQLACDPSRERKEAGVTTVCSSQHLPQVPNIQAVSR